MYTPLMGDEKRDIVEYTSFGFMNCAHTMLTYTRAMDSALCVPLMIDAAVWCDYFAREGTPQDRVARALAYLFKVPEGGAQGVDPGFFKQMRALEEELEATRLGASGTRVDGGGGEGGAPRVAAPGVAEMLVGRVVCAGISCLDLQLCGSSGGRGEGGVETIRKFEETKYCPGGSCPQASTALAQLGVPGVVAVTKMGVDAHGDEMIRQASVCRCRETCCLEVFECCWLWEVLRAGVPQRRGKARHQLYLRALMLPVVVVCDNIFVFFSAVMRRYSSAG